ncbi:MAG: 50S ribosomal protein L15 [Candidatus Liptonbacteria bacterium]|nr:50S ribosomal protein L15 [Candidatus Liptonbacteria bacterium]
MQLHELKPAFKSKRVKRIGRGGKRGTYSGRGQKGQKSRAGRRIRPAQRDLILRIPKKRGFQNKPKGPKPLTLNIKDLAKAVKILATGKVELTIDREKLKSFGLLPSRYRGEVKILGDGEIQTPFTLRGLKVSKSAKIKIEAAGGKVLGFAQKSESSNE